MKLKDFNNLIVLIKNSGYDVLNLTVKEAIQIVKENMK